MFKGKAKAAKCQPMAGHHFLLTHPRILLPLAVIHVIPIALFIHGMFKYATLHEKKALVKEQTKQLKYRH